MAGHPTLMDLWQTEHADMISISDMGQWAGDSAGLNIESHPSNEMDTEGLSRSIFPRC
jgi:hypothetical protein